MSRIWMAVLSILGITAGGVLGSAYWAGLQAEKQYRAYLAQEASTDSQVRLTPAGYRRGWLASEAVTQVDMTLPQEAAASGDRRLRFSLEHHIYHGILPVAEWVREGFSPRPVQAVVHTVLTGDADWVTHLKALYGRQEPLRVVSSVALDGSIDSQITMPPLDIDAQGEFAYLAFSGLQGRLWVAPLGRAFKGEISVPALQAAGRHGVSLRLRGLWLSVDQQLGRSQWMTGDSVLKLDEFQWQDPKNRAGSVALNGVALRARITEQNDLLESHLAVELNNVVLAAQESEAVRLHMTLRNLDGALLQRLNRWSETQQAAAADVPGADEGLALLQGLLQRHPELTLKAQLHTRQGALQADAEFILQDPGPIQWDDPWLPVRALARAQAEATVAKGLLEAALLAITRARLQAAAAEQDWEPEEAALTELAEAQSEQHLAWLKAFNVIQVAGDSYHTRVQVQDGWLSLNGKEIPLLF